MTARDVLDRVLTARARAEHGAARDVARSDTSTTAGDVASVRLLIERGRLEEEFAAYPAAAAAFRDAAGLADTLTDPAEAGTWRARALAGLASVRRAEGRSDEADPLLAEALELVDAFPGGAPAAVVAVLLEAGRRRAELAQHGQAQSLFERATAGAETAADGPERDGWRAQAWGALAGSYRMQGRFAEAEPLFRRAIGLAESVFGAASLEVANLLNDLAIVFKFTGRFVEAEELYRRSLALLTAAFATEEHPDVASLYHNLGGLAHARGDFAAAEAPARRAVEIREAVLGADHIHAAADRSALGSILDALGRHDEAEGLFRQALELFERRYGPDHYEVAVNLNNIAVIERRRGRLVEAELLYRRALAIKERLLGSESPETGFTLNNLAVVCKLMGRLDEAEALYRRALRSFEQGLEPTHPALAKARSNHAKLRRDRAAAGDTPAPEAPVE